MLELGRDAKAEAGWLWIAHQVRRMLNAEARPAVSLLPIIRDRLLACGFKGSRGLDSECVVRTLETRFGRSLLVEANAVSSPMRAMSHLWPQRMLGEHAVSNRRFPNVLRALLLSSLVCENVDDLSGNLPPREQRLCEPKGYGSKPCSAAHLTPGAVESAIRLARGSLNSAAVILKTSSHTLSSFMRNMDLRHPLSQHVVHRLGIEKIEAVRAALQAGEAKESIESRTGVREWSVRLIELDRPELRHAHRAATIANLRSVHRAALEQYTRDYPKAKQAHLAQTLKGAYDWLRVFDADWLKANMPARTPRVVQKKPAFTKQWGEIDEECASKIALASAAEMAKSARPVRQSFYALLIAVNSPVKQKKYLQTRMPKTLSAALHYAESWEAFQKRKIIWGMLELRALDIPISMRRLRRVVGLRPTVIVAHRQVIIEMAERLQLGFDAKCCLSPLLPPAAVGRAAAGAPLRRRLTG